MTEAQKMANKREEMRTKLMYMREKMDKRADKIIKDRAMHRERRERQASEKAANELEVKAERRINDLGGEDIYQIDNDKDEELRKAKYTQMLRGSPEIQDLMKQLDIAYTRKGLEAQVEHQRLKGRTEEDEEEKLINNESENEEALLVQENKKKAEYNQQLRNQLIYKNKLKQIDYKKFLKEKALLEDKIKATHEEDQLELNRKKSKIDKYKKEIEDYCETRKSWALKEKELQQLNEKKIEEFIKSKEKFNEEEEKKEKIKREEFNRKRNLVYNTLSQIQDTRVESENANLLRVEEEAEQKAQENEKAELMKRFKMKQDLLNSSARTFEDMEERKRRNRLEDELYVKEKLAQYQEDKKCQEMTMEKRRRLKMAYKSCLLREIEEKKFRRKLEDEQILKLKESEEFKKKEQKRLIYEERLKILQEHTGGLVGYLPAGTLNPSDLPHLPEHVRQHYSGKVSNS